jgi:transposase
MAPSMALFPPGKGGGEGVAHGGKGKGILIHSLTEGRGMPLANRVTPAKGDAQAQVVPLLDAVKVHTGKRGRPRKRLTVIATDKGYDAQALRQQLRKRGGRAQIPKRVWKTTKNRGRPIKKTVPRFQAERTFAWFQKKYRRVVVRWERIAACFEAFLALATVHIWVQRLIVGYIHGIHMDFTKAVPIFISGVLSLSMMHMLMVVSPDTQACINAVFIRIHTCTWSNGLFDERFDGLLLHIGKHVDDHLTTSLHHPKDGWPLFV